MSREPTSKQVEGVQSLGGPLERTGACQLSPCTSWGRGCPREVIIGMWLDTQVCEG